jgi:hypothetical protein
MLFFSFTLRIHFGVVKCYSFHYIYIYIYIGETVFVPLRSSAVKNLGTV